MPTLGAVVLAVASYASSSSIHGNKAHHMSRGTRTKLSTLSRPSTRSACMGAAGAAPSGPGFGAKAVRKSWALPSWRPISFLGSRPPSSLSLSVSEKERGGARRRGRVAALATADSGGGGGPMGAHQNKDGEGSPASPSPGARFITLPTLLTLGRVAAVPLLVGTFYMDNWWGTTATTGIFIAAAITDWLDGYLARKMQLGTPFGAFLDPVADKLMVAATLVLLCTRPLEVGSFSQSPWLLPVPAIAIIGREITMSAVREWAASQNTKLLEAVAVNNLGKWKTATQMTALTILLATRDNSLSGSGVLVASGVLLLYISAGLAIWSLAVYMRKIWRVLLK